MGYFEYAFSGMNVDYAMLVKLYDESPEAEKRYARPSVLAASALWFLAIPILTTSTLALQNVQILAYACRSDATYC